MKERPILFSGPMVAAILAGRKTQTRRIVKPQPPLGHNFVGFTVSSTHRKDEGKATFAAGDVSELLHDARRVRCPYGKPGDRLWVKETWRTGKGLDKYSPKQMAAKCLDAGYKTPWAPLHYDADGPVVIGSGEPRDFGGEWGKTRVSIHMPRWASRINLEVTGVRVERLNDISEEDAKAEGLACKSKDGSLFKYGIADRDGLPGNDDHGWHWIWWRTDPRVAYRQLWEQINGCDSWYDNPWVWVVTFQRAKT